MKRVVAIGLALVWSAAAADEAPAWLKDLSAVALPQYAAKVTTVVMLNEERTTVADNGKLTTSTRTAIRILARQGADVTFFEQYDTASAKVRDFRAWMIGPTGKVKKYGNDKILDIACAENDVYNECRRRMVSGRRDAEAGSLFGYESTVEHQSFSNQLQFRFQDAAPVRQARFIVTTPPGWEIKSSSFNGAPREAASGTTYTWQMENLAAMEPEAASPAFMTLVPWVRGESTRAEWQAPGTLMDRSGEAAGGVE